MVSKYKDKWIFCKHKERKTWEIPAGRIEQDEISIDAAKRELYEETGAINYVINPICIFHIEQNDNESYGVLYFVEVLEYDNLPDMEIERIAFFDNIPMNLTYPSVQPRLFRKALKYMHDFKDTSEMTRNELYKLFPIIIDKHNPKWINWYEEERKNILKNVSNIFSINHYGSTAIPHIMSKPTIDILIEVDKQIDLSVFVKEIENIGYFKMNEENNLPMFAKGYSKYGFAEKVFHIHVRNIGIQKELLFRDYLNMHDNIAEEYQKLKLELMCKHKYNRDMYTKEKTNFINEIYKNIEVM